VNDPKRTESGFTSGAIEAICLTSIPTHNVVRVIVGAATIDIVCSAKGRSASVYVRHGPRTNLRIEQTLWSSEDD
jgi:hypothetical protein